MWDKTTMSQCSQQRSTFGRKLTCLVRFWYVSHWGSLRDHWGKPHGESRGWPRNRGFPTWDFSKANPRLLGSDKQVGDAFFSIICVMLDHFLNGWFPIKWPWVTFGSFVWFVYFCCSHASIFSGREWVAESYPAQLPRRGCLGIFAVSVGYVVFQKYFKMICFLLFPPHEVVKKLQELLHDLFLLSFFCSSLSFYRGLWLQ